MNIKVGPFGPLAFTCPNCSTPHVYLDNAQARPRAVTMQLRCREGHTFEVGFIDGDSSGTDGWLRDGHPTVLPPSLAEVGA